MNRKEELLALIEETRKQVSCCCSFHRYEQINELMDEMEEILKRIDDENSTGN